MNKPDYNRNPNLTEVESLLKTHMWSIKLGNEVNDYPELIYAAVMEAYYGSDIWEYKARMTTK